MEFVDLIKLENLTGILEKSDGRFKILYFFVNESPVCDQITDVLEDLSCNDGENYKDFLCCKIDSEKFDFIAKQFNVTKVPTVIIRQEKEIHRIEGANVPALVKAFRDTLSMKSIESDLNSRLEKLINKASCMLFMKGSPEVPRCGFSKQVIELLNKHSAKFETFDILEDLEVREGLKKYSNWPTYPQLYVKGELIGGLDILRELSESGELSDILKQD